MIYARIKTQNKAVLDLTPGKSYEVLREEDALFWVLNDVDYELCCAWEGCAHLDGDWERIEIPDDGEVE